MTTNNSKALEKSGGFPTEKVELIKRTIAKGTTQDELELFLYTCERMGLDPLAKQIYCVKYGGQMSIQTGIDGYRLIADRTGKYCPGAETEFEHDSDGKLVAATAYVAKLVAGQWHQVSAKALLSEYQGTGNLWKRMPSVMLEKCAESRALRRAFPAELSGVYTSEEMNQAASQGPITVESREVPPIAPQLPTPAEPATKPISAEAAAKGIRKKWDDFIKDMAVKHKQSPTAVWWNAVKQALGWECHKEKGEATAVVYARWTLEDVADIDRFFVDAVERSMANVDDPEAEPLPDPPPPPDVPSVDPFDKGRHDPNAAAPDGYEADPFTGDYMDSGVQRELGE